MKRAVTLLDHTALLKKHISRTTLFYFSKFSSNAIKFSISLFDDLSDNFVVVYNWKKVQVTKLNVQVLFALGQLHTTKLLLVVRHTVVWNYSWNLNRFTEPIHWIVVRASSIFISKKYYQLCMQCGRSFLNELRLLMCKYIFLIYTNATTMIDGEFCRKFKTNLAVAVFIYVTHICFICLIWVKMYIKIKLWYKK